MKNNSQDNNFIIASYSFDTQGNAINVASQEVAQKLKNKRLAWAHLDGNDENSKTWLEKNVPYLDHLIIDALFAYETRPRIIEFEDGMLVILRGANCKNGKKQNEMSSIRLWIDESRIISVQRKDFMPIIELMNIIESGTKKISNAGEFMFNLVSETLNSVDTAIDGFDQEIDQVEKKINSRNKTNNYALREILSNVRKQTAVFKRYMIPQKDVLSHLQSSHYKWIDDLSIRHFQESFNHICHMIEELGEIKERSKIIYQDLSNINTDKINKSMFNITLIASIFLPLGFIASLFGMNVGGVPLVNDSSGFFIISYFMAVIFGALYLMIKSRSDH